ncbi:pantoate--beta-alanine ligase [Methylomagnum sp.]
MRTAESIPELREIVRAWRAQGLSVAFVPTMGNLHDGHIRLVEEAKRQGDRVVVSIFVNPTQFGPCEDFAAYPRTPEQDAEKLLAAGTDLLFLPGATELYPQEATGMAFVEVPGLSSDLCGRFRPGHFRGVATVVCKLLNQVQPDAALFGEKDYQQLTVIRRLVADLDLPVRIHGVPTAREPNGLAMSSRNAYLSDQEKTQAGLLYASLREAAEEIHRGERDFGRIEKEKTEALSAHGFLPDYFAIRRQDGLDPPGADDSRLVILVAARLGQARLIDNLQVVV